MSKYSHGTQFYLSKIGDSVDITDEDAARMTANARCEALLPLVPMMIGRHFFWLESEDNYDDALQEGNIGLLKACRSWKPGEGSKLVSWACTYIRRYIQSFLDREERWLGQHETNVGWLDGAHNDPGVGYYEGDCKSGLEFEELQSVPDEYHDMQTIPGPEEALIAAEEEGELRKAWAEPLSRQQQLIFDLMAEGAKPAEIATELGLPVGTVYGQQNRIREKIQNLLRN